MRDWFEITPGKAKELRRRKEEVKLLISLKDIQKYTIRSAEGDLGELRSFLIDDFDWVVRYIVVDAGDRSILISTRSLREPVVNGKILETDLTLDRIANSPAYQLDQPLSRVLERQLSDYYDWPYYWEPTEVPNTLSGDLSAVPLIEMQLEREQKEQEQALILDTGSVSTARNELRLHFTSKIFGYTIHASNDNKSAGKLDDFIVQSEDWKIMYMVVSGSGLRSGGRVLVSPSWVEQIAENNSRIDVNLKEETIRISPAYNGTFDLTSDYQDRLRGHYGR